MDITSGVKGIKCPICQTSLVFSLATSRKAKRKKAFVMVKCPGDGRHFRGFISDQKFVGKLVDSSLKRTLDSPGPSTAAGTGRGRGNGIRQ